MMDYSKRLDRTVILYITAAYAAIGLKATGQIKLDNLNDEKLVWLVFLFIFLNGCILLHGMSQSCWSMAIAKFIHIKLDRELLTITGNDIKDPKCEMKQLNDIDAICWDDWRKEIKDIANRTRDVAVFLWLFLIVSSSICSLTFVNLPLFFKNYGILGYLAVAFLILIYGFIILCFLYEAFYGIFLYHSLKKVPRYLLLLIHSIIIFLALSLTTLAVWGGYYATTCHQEGKIDNGNTSSATPGIRSQEGTDTQLRNEAVPVNPGT